VNKLISFLRYVLRDSGLHTPEEWGHIIGVTPEAQDRWLDGTQVPTPTALRRLMIAATATNNEVLLASWAELRSLTVTEACPQYQEDPLWVMFFAREATTLAHVIVEPLWIRMVGTLRSLSPDSQSKILKATIKAAQEDLFKRNGRTRD